MSVLRRPPKNAPNLRTVATAAAAFLVAAGLAQLEPSGPADEQTVRPAALATASGTPFDAPAARLDKSPAPADIDVPPHHAEAANLAPFPSEMGEASWYDLHGDATANGETMNVGGLTAAHAMLPLGTRALVENLKNGQIVVVRINDRLPPGSGRIIDLSKAAAEQLDMIADGIATVRVRQVEESLAGALGAPGTGVPIDYH